MKVYPPDEHKTISLDLLILRILSFFSFFFLAEFLICLYNGSTKCMRRKVE